MDVRTSRVWLIAVASALFLVPIGEAKAQRIRKAKLPDGTEVEIDLGEDPPEASPPRKGASGAAKVVKPKFDAEAAVRAYVKENCNDPDKLDFVAFTKPVDLAGCYAHDGFDKQARELGYGWKPAKTAGVAVVAKYRTANAVGAKILVQEVFCLNAKGEVIHVLTPENFRTSRPEPKSDPFTEAFLDGLGKP